jgi:hypothetical protein
MAELSQLVESQQAFQSEQFKRRATSTDSRLPIALHNIQANDFLEKRLGEVTKVLQETADDRISRLPTPVSTEKAGLIPNEEKPTSEENLSSAND